MGKAAHPRYVLSRNGNQRFEVGMTECLSKCALRPGLKTPDSTTFVTRKPTGTSIAKPVMALGESDGWGTIEMVQKYAHLAPSHLAAHASTVTFWSQAQEEAKENGNKDCALVAVNY